MSRGGADNINELRNLNKMPPLGDEKVDKGTNLHCVLKLTTWEEMVKKSKRKCKANFSNKTGLGHSEEKYFKEKLKMSSSKGEKESSRGEN